MSAVAETSVVCGIHPVGELIETRPEAIERIYFRQNIRHGALFELLKKCRRRRIPYQVVPPARLDAIARGAVHQGVAALRTARAYESFEDIVCAAAADSDRDGLILVPASVEDPHNLGAIVRSAVAFNVHGIAVERHHTAPLSETVVKSSAGMIEHARIARPRSLEAVIAGLKQHAWQVVGAVADGAKLPHEVDFTAPTVLIMGGEHRGLPPYLHKLCDTTVRIPLNPRVESLNVSVATGIMLYECDRQRQGVPGGR
jgi:23S rRNA (guanosine2251-2'-O)-methyltransferase